MKATLIVFIGLILVAIGTIMVSYKMYSGMIFSFIGGFLVGAFFTKCLADLYEWVQNK